MSETQTEIATQGEPNGETVPQPATDTAPITGQEQPAEQTTETPEPKKTPWFQRRIDELTREKHEARRQADAYADALRKIQQPAGQVEAPQTTAPPGYIPAAEVPRVAAEMVEAERFTAACNDVADYGSEKIPDFDRAVQNFAMLGGPPRPFLEAVTALGKEDGARVYAELGNNPDEAERILRMSPARMAIEVAKLAAKPAKVPAVSKAPPPITPISAGGAVSNGPPDPKNDAAYRQWFAKEMAKHR